MSEGKPAKLYDIFARKSIRPLVIAHRGGAGIAPENTLFAFKRSADLGADVLELDIRSTSDGELVVIHDANVDRTTEGTGAVDEIPLEELKKLDAGYRWTEDDGKTFPFRGKGIKIPTLRQVFEAFPEITINIEPKHDAPSPIKPLCNLITEFNRKDKVIVGTFRDEVLEDFRRNCKGVATSASPSEASFFLAGYEIGLSKSYSPEMQVLQIPEKLGSLQIVTEDYIKSAHERNLDVHVWTINDVEDMKRLIKIKADGIMTNYPDRLLELLKNSN
jgi:glycerophosphoryl diester phosphodiesterase